MDARANRHNARRNMQDELPAVRDVNLNQPYLPQYKRSNEYEQQQDFSNTSIAFNSLNRLVALCNVQVLRPQFSPILINTKRETSRMIVLGKDEI